MESLYIDHIGKDFDKCKFLDDLLKKDISWLEFKYSSDFKNTKILRDFMELISEKLKVWDVDKARLVLVCDEMNNNSIEYGSIQGDINYMRVYFKKCSKGVELQIEVEDTWKGKKHRTAQQMEELKAFRLKHGYSQHNSIRWRGLFMIIINIVNEIYFKDSAQWGLIVWIKVKIPTI